MFKPNVQTVQEYIEAMNRKQFQRIFEFCSADCIIRGEPFEGIGAIGKADREGRFVLKSVFQNGSAGECLQIGDELVRVVDSDHVWDKFSEFEKGTWNRGMAGTPVTVTVRRAGRSLECHLTRDVIESYNIKLSERIETIQKESRMWSKLVEKVNLIFGHDDLVAVYSTFRGTPRENDGFAAWSACCIYRLKDGKIIEMIGLAK